MAQGVPVQIIKIETIRKQRIDYILNNLSLAMYAKLGGIPWTLAPNTDMAHEIVVGIGSARLTDSRRGAGEGDEKGGHFTADSVGVEGFDQFCVRQS